MPANNVPSLRRGCIPSLLSYPPRFFFLPKGKIDPIPFLASSKAKRISPPFFLGGLFPLQILFGSSFFFFKYGGTMCFPPLPQLGFFPSRGVVKILPPPPHAPPVLFFFYKTNIFLIIPGSHVFLSEDSNSPLPLNFSTSIRSPPKESKSPLR